MMKKDKVKKKKNVDYEIRWITLTSTSSLLVCKVFFSGLKTKSLDSKTTKGHQAMEGPFRVSTSSVNTLQIKLVQAWTR